MRRLARIAPVEFACSRRRGRPPFTAGRSLPSFLEANLLVLAFALARRRSRANRGRLQRGMYREHRDQQAHKDAIGLSRGMHRLKEYPECRRSQPKTSSRELNKRPAKRSRRGSRSPSTTKAGQPYEPASSSATGKVRPRANFVEILAGVNPQMAANIPPKKYIQQLEELTARVHYERF